MICRLCGRHWGSGRRDKKNWNLTLISTSGMSRPLRLEFADALYQVTSRVIGARTFTLMTLIVGFDLFLLTGVAIGWPCGSR